MGKNYNVEALANTWVLVARMKRTKDVFNTYVGCGAAGREAVLAAMKDEGYTFVTLFTADRLYEYTKGEYTGRNEKLWAGNLYALGKAGFNGKDAVVEFLGSLLDNLDEEFYKDPEWVDGCNLEWDGEAFNAGTVYEEPEEGEDEPEEEVEAEEGAEEDDEDEEA